MSIGLVLNDILTRKLVKCVTKSQCGFHRLHENGIHFLLKLDADCASQLARQGYYNEAKALMTEKENMK